MVCRWYKMFAEGRTEVRVMVDQVTSVTKENTTRVRDFLESDRHLILREMFYFLARLQQSNH